MGWGPKTDLLRDLALLRVRHCICCSGCDWHAWERGIRVRLKENVICHEGRRGRDGATMVGKG